MNIIYEFTEEEKIFIEEFKSINLTFNYSGSFDDFRKKYKDEISDFIKNGLIYHSNRDSEGAYIRYSATAKLLKILK